MIKEEFESLTGCKATNEDWYVFEKLYLGAGEMDKAAFCADVKASALVSDGFDGGKAIAPREWMRKVADKSELNYNKRIAIEAYSRTHLASAAELLLRYAEKFNSREMRDATVQIVGPLLTARVALERGYSLTAEERDAVLAELPEECGPIGLTVADVTGLRETKRSSPRGRKTDAAAAAEAIG